MPVRSTILTTGQAYHVFNRGLDRRPTFTSKQEYRRAIATLSYYQYGNHTRSLSHHLSRSNDEQSEYLSRMTAMDRIVDIVAFCLMPNHFHFLIIQLKDDGISTFLKQFQGSFTKYSNPRHDRTGALFQGQFKAVRIESEEQFWHVSRYIHLNPYTGSVVSSAAKA